MPTEMPTYAHGKAHVNAHVNIKKMKGEIRLNKKKSQLIKKGLSTRKTRALALALALSLSSSYYVSAAPADVYLDDEPVIIDGTSADPTTYGGNNIILEGGDYASTSTDSPSNVIVRTREALSFEFNSLEFDGFGGVFQVLSDLTTDTVLTIANDITVTTTAVGGDSRIIVSSTVGTTTDQNSTLKVKGSIYDDLGLGTGDLAITVGYDGTNDGTGKATLDVDGNVILTNTGSTIALNSTYGAVEVKVGGNIGDVVLDSYGSIDTGLSTPGAPINTTVGAGLTTDGLTQYNVDVTAKNIYVRGLTTTTTGTDDDADAMNGNVSYTAKNDFYATGVSIGITQDSNGTIATTDVHASGGDIKYVAGNDLNFVITNAADNLSSSNTTIDKGYHGNILYEATRNDLTINYSNVGGYTFTGNQFAGEGNLSYEAGRDIVITADALTYNGGAGNVNILAGHDITLGTNFFTYIGNGSGELDITAFEGNIAVLGDVDLQTKGSGSVDIIANFTNKVGNTADPVGNIFVDGDFKATVDTGSSGDITVKAQEKNHTAYMIVLDDMTLTNKAGLAGTPTDFVPGDIKVTADNFFVGGYATGLTLDASASDGSVTMTAPHHTQLTNFDGLIDAYATYTSVPSDVVAAGAAPYLAPFKANNVYGFDPARGSVTLVVGDIEIKTGDGTAGQSGTAALATDNLVIVGDLTLDGTKSYINANRTDVNGIDWAVFGGNSTIAWMNTDATSQDKEMHFHRIALAGDLTAATAKNTELTTDVYNNVLVSSDLLFVPDGFEATLYSTPGAGGTLTPPERLDDGSLYVGSYANLPNTVVTGIQTDRVVLGAGSYDYTTHTFDQTRLVIADKLVMDTTGKIDMYDGSNIHFAYNKIDLLNTTPGGITNDNFAASNLNTNNISYTFTDAATLVTEADANANYSWNQPYHNLVLSMDVPTNPASTDDLTTIGLVDVASNQIKTNLDTSPFFVITSDYVAGVDDNNVAYTAADQYGYAINNIIWQPDVIIERDSDGNLQRLQSKAPTSALGSMAYVLDNAPEYDLSASSNGIANLLYMSTSQDDYNRSLTNISAGGNLNAIYMANHRAHTMAIEHAGELNRMGKSEERNGVWGTVYHNYTSVDEDYANGANGFNVKRWGFLGGLDRQINEKTTVGLYLDVSRPKLTNDNYGRIDGDDFQIGVYGSWKLPKKYEVNLAIGGGWQSYDAWRSVYVQRSGNKPYSESLDSRYDGNNFDIALEVARVYENDKTWLRPAIGYNFQSTDLDGFTERGSNLPGTSVAQRVDGTSLDQHFLKAGLSGGWKSDKSAIKAKLFWVGRISGDDRPESNAWFISPTSVTGGSRFLVQGAEMDKNYFNFGLGYTRYLNASKTTSLSFDYETLLGSNTKNHLFDVALSVKF